MEFSDTCAGISGARVFKPNNLKNKEIIFSLNGKYYLIIKYYVDPSTLQYVRPDIYHLVKLKRTSDDQSIVTIARSDQYSYSTHINRFFNNLVIISRAREYRFTFVDLNNEQVCDYQSKISWHEIYPNPTNTLLYVYGVYARFSSGPEPDVIRFYDISDFAKGCVEVEGMAQYDVDCVNWENKNKWLDDKTIEITEYQEYCKNCNLWRCCTCCLEYDPEDKPVSKIIFQKINNRMEIIDYTIIEPAVSVWGNILKKK